MDFFPVDLACENEKIFFLPLKWIYLYDRALQLPNRKVCFLKLHSTLYRAKLKEKEWFLHFYIYHKVYLL